MDATIPCIDPVGDAAVHEAPSPATVPGTWAPTLAGCRIRVRDVLPRPCRAGGCRPRRCARGAGSEKRCPATGVAVGAGRRGSPARRESGARGRGRVDHPPLDLVQPELQRRVGSGRGDRQGDRPRAPVRSDHHRAVQVPARAARSARRAGVADRLPVRPHAGLRAISSAMSWRWSDSAAAPSRECTISQSENSPRSSPASSRKRPTSSGTRRT